jgi:hypothetical protein
MRAIPDEKTNTIIRNQITKAIRKLAAQDEAK